MNIKKLTSSSCDRLSENLKSNFDESSSLYHNHDSNNFVSLCSDLPKIENPFYSVGDEYCINGQINLLADENNIYDFENAVKIYSIFNPQLSPFEANDERLWVRLTHDQCHKYMVKRWMTKSLKSDKVIEERFFFKGRSQSARVRNGISRLWWIAHLTVQNEEENFDNKWKFTKALCESQDFITSLFERSIGSYENIRFGVLEFYLENPELFAIEKSKKIQKILRDLNNYGGVSLLSLMSKEEIKQILSTFM
jgi:hypothetical protein